MTLITSVIFTLLGAGTFVLRSLRMGRRCKRTVSGEYGIMRDEKQNLHFVDETFAVRISCTDGTSCGFRETIGSAWCNDPPSAVEE
jgi:hypothetical protein